MSNILYLEGCKVDLVNCSVRSGTGTEPLTPLEVKLLTYLHDHKGRTVPTTDLLEGVWNYSPKAQTRAVTYAVRRLRSKIERDPGNPAHLLTVRGVGFRFELPQGQLIGRATELSTISETLEERGALVIIGGPGFGKTALANAWMESRPDDTLWCDAADVVDRSTLLLKLSEALEIDPVDSYAPIARSLAHRELVLVLDNVEQVLEPVLSFVAHLTSPILLTSRIRLVGLPVLVLHPLAGEDAAEIFRREGIAHVPGWVPLEHRAAIASISERLHGIPLALVLAAHALRWFSAAEIDRRLASSFELLDAVPTSPLSAAIERSVALLDEPTQRALAWLSCFQHQSTVNAVEAVLSAGLPRPLLALSTLEEHGLVHVQRGAVHIRPGVLKAAAAMLLELGEQDEAWAAHAAHYLSSPDDPTAFHELLALHQRVLGTDPALAQQALLVAHDSMLVLLTPHMICDRLLATEAALGTLHPKLASLLGWALWRLGERAKASVMLEQIQTDEPSVVASVLRFRAGILQESGGGAGALLLLKRALQVLEGADQPLDRAHVLNALAIVQAHRGDLPAAFDAVYGGIECATTDPNLRTSLFNTLGNIHLRKGDLKQAKNTYDQVLEQLGESTGHRRWVVESNRAAVLVSLNDLEGARTAYTAAVEAHRRSGGRRSLALSLGNLGRVQHLSDELDDAVQSFQECVLHLEAVGDSLRAGWFRVLQGTALLDAGRSGEASRTFRLARQHEQGGAEPWGEEMEALVAAHAAVNQPGPPNPGAQEATIDRLERVASSELLPMVGRLRAKLQGSGG